MEQKIKYDFIWINSCKTPGIMIYMMIGRSSIWNQNDSKDGQTTMRLPQIDSALNSVSSHM